MNNTRGVQIVALSYAAATQGGTGRWHRSVPSAETSSAQSNTAVSNLACCLVHNNAGSKSEFLQIYGVRLSAHWNTGVVVCNGKMWTAMMLKLLRFPMHYHAGVVTPSRTRGDANARATT